MKKHIKIPFVSYFNKKAGQGKQNYNPQEQSLSNNDNLFFSSPGDTLCFHIEYCTLRKVYRDKNKYINCFKESALKCQTRKYYDRYGNNPLGIGSKI